MVSFGKFVDLTAWVRSASRLPAGAGARMAAGNSRGVAASGAMVKGRGMDVHASGAERERGAGNKPVLARGDDALRTEAKPIGALLPDLDALRCLLGEAEVLRFHNAEIRDICDHSQQVTESALFFAVSGHEADGARFASDAVARGACAVVADRPLPVAVPCFVVPDVRRAASRVAARFFGEPGHAMHVVGVTGTNGKTTVVDLLRLCLEDDGQPIGSLGTIEYRLGPRAGGVERVLPATNTTPGPIELQRLLREMWSRGARHAVLEVSSHALDQGRVHALPFETALFTNLSQDHLDYHGTMEAYGAAKARLFAELGAGKLAVVPADDPSAAPILAALRPEHRVATWALGSTLPDALPKERGTHVRGEILRETIEGTKMRVRTRDGCVDVQLPLVGEHNARNALAAMATAIAMGIGPLRVGAAMSRARPVRGRLERVPGFAQFHVFVDYAHTPDALERVLASLRPLTRGSLRVVFGCGGERDVGKRAQMGRIAAEGADHVVVTHDNPRREDPEKILRDVLEGIADLDETDAAVEVCADRRQAIWHALSRSKAGDTVLIAGKGHESGQQIGTTLHPFDDREVALEWLQC